MQGIAKMTQWRLWYTTVVVTLALGVPAPDVHSDDNVVPAIAAAAAIPGELRGFWDLAPDPCTLDPKVESDSRLEIGDTFVRGYEELMEVREVVRVSETPQAWRVLAISGIAPADVQGPALYVLSGDSLTIADAEQSRIYVRCRETTVARDAS